jgi:catechol-2,3-dioxygenase
LFFSADVFGMERFYGETLGLRVSDRITGRVSFLNCGTGDHHVFGFLPSSHRGLHHLSFEVSGIDEMAMGAQVMAAGGHRELAAARLRRPARCLVSDSASGIPSEPRAQVLNGPPYSFCNG